MHFLGADKNKGRKLEIHQPPPSFMMSQMGEKIGLRTGTGELPKDEFWYFHPHLF